MLVRSHSNDKWHLKLKAGDTVTLTWCDLFIINTKILETETAMPNEVCRECEARFDAS